MPGIYVGGPTKDYSAMQGPAPDGFHVPLNTEWQAVYNIWTALGGGSNDGANFGIALKMPFAGYRNYEAATAYDQGVFGNYWSSSRSNENQAYSRLFNASAILPQYNYYRAYGFSVRCFKNSPTVPTSSWTKLYGTSIESGGIFWSSADGLISLSSDGSTWITIQDKNLGTTQVWNSGDTVSEANCGKYYQRGNNYGFAWTGSLTTSSTQVNASVYGPGNYYSSSTFITRGSSPYRWDSTDNGNLRGGVTGIVERTGEVKSIYVGATPVKGVYLGDTKIRPKPMPAGIYHNATLGLISLSSDGSNWLTIADKNLGATTVWNSGDTLSQANCGNFYQRGNNRGFPYSGWVSTSSTKVNAGSYGPGNYYSSSIFITDYSYWDSSFNSNLRGGVTDTKEARQGPCPTGFYVPSGNDWTNIRDIWGGLGGGYNNGTDFGKYLKMPFAGSRNEVNGNVGDKGGYGDYWSSNYSGFANGITIRISSSEIYPGKTQITPRGLSIRPFKNVAVQPDASRTKLY